MLEDKSLYKIVLTGGPCAGKTTALARLEESLVEKGFHVFIVSESATELIKGGARPFGKNAIDMVAYQRLMLDYQLSKERIYENASFLNGSNKNVIIYDRGVLDNKAYINQSIFDKLLSELGVSEIDLMDNYDMVIHMVTAADGKSECYTLANNGARTESIEQAIELDKKTLNAWMGHQNLKIVDNSTEFDEKINRVLDHVNSLVGIKDMVKTQRKYLIDLNSSDISCLDSETSTIIDIEQIYLASNNPTYEIRLRKRTIGGHSTYYFQTEKKIGNGKSIVITDKKISSKEYVRTLSNYKIDKKITKTRYAFTYDKQNMTLDVFEGGLCILEVNGNKKINLPSYLNVIEEVTNDEKYNNINLARTIKTLSNTL